jgi:hypothetical protein
VVKGKGNRSRKRKGPASKAISLEVEASLYVPKVEVALMSEFGSVQALGVPVLGLSCCFQDTVSEEPRGSN